MGGDCLVLESLKDKYEGWERTDERKNRQGKLTDFYGDMLQETTMSWITL